VGATYDQMYPFHFSDVSPAWLGCGYEAIDMGLTDCKTDGADICLVTTRGIGTDGQTD
jgi:hypothetical protein